jgi:SAM-dependent methyltransferase
MFKLRLYLLYESVELRMDKYIGINRELWNELTPIHARSDYYDLEGFRSGKSTLRPIELEELGDVYGKSLLHLQCHFGLDTLSWARLGAKATGVDFSDKAIALARRLSKETGIEASFVHSDIYDLPKKLYGQFDIVFTSYGILCWLPDLRRWAEIITLFMKPGGTFYMVADHPLNNIFESVEDSSELKVAYSYFHTPEPIKWEPGGSYADPNAKVSHPSYEWTHSLSDVLNALISTGLRIEFVHEFPVCAWQRFPAMEQDKDGWWRLKGDNIPFTFSLRATKD